MARIESHRDLIVWQKAMEMSVAIYKISERFPRTETYRLTDQICRAAISVAGNIAEGHVRSTAKDYAHYLSISRGSLMETETYLMLSERLGYATTAQLQPTLTLITEISKMLTSLRRSVLASSRSS